MTYIVDRNVWASF